MGLPAVGQVESVLNGGFETGDLTNWILAGDYTYTYLDGGSEFVPHSGSYEALLGNNTAPGTLSQTVATTPGTTYVLSCWFNNSYGDPGQFSVSWDGSVLLNETDPVANGWVNYQFTVTATQASTVVQFGFFDNAANYFGLDDVSLQSQTNIAPTITIQPTNVTVFTGQPATFSVAATGSAPINYQWQFGGMAKAGANSSSYTIGSTVPTDAGNYSCLVSNSTCTTNSVMAMLTVISTPVITLQPTNVTVYAGQPATFSVAAMGPEPLYYQWQFGVNGTNIVGATNATLNLTNVQPTNGGIYTVTVGNAYGTIVSSIALLTVQGVLPFITTQPTNQTVYPGDMASFTAAAGGTSPLNYKWSFNGTNVIGATNDTLSLINVQPTDGGVYTMTASNAYGGIVSSNALLTVVFVLPFITTQPTNQTVYVGDTASFTAVAGGTLPFNYQWSFNGTNIFGATNATLNLINVQPTNGGIYTVTASNPYGSIVSSNALLTVQVVLPFITTQPTNQTVNAGYFTIFNVAAGGTSPLNYQWSFNGTNIVGAIFDQLNLINVQPTNGGVYAVTVNNAYGSIVSSNALLTVRVVLPFITMQPTNQTVYEGDTASFTAAAGGTSPLKYQWIFNATNLVGATNAALIITNAQPNQSGNYSLLVSNAYGSTNSVTVTLTINLTLPLLPFPLSANQRGTVTCLENPSYTYDIYLPPAYTTRGTALPIFYTMYANGGGMVGTFQSTCSNLNMICVGITGSKNGEPWDQIMCEIYAVTRDVRQRVLYDPTAEFAGGFSGGGECAYMFARMRAQHVAGLFEMAGNEGRGNLGSSVQFYGTDRLQTNLLVARATGTSDTTSIFYNPYYSNYLAYCDAVVQDWFFSGGHAVPPSSLFPPVLSWLVSQRTPAGPNDRANALMLSTNWQDRIAAGQQQSVLFECVSNLMNFPRTWFAYQAQLTLDQLLTNYTVFRTLNVSNLAQGDFASDFFYYYARGAATNADWNRYDSCMKALTGIAVTNDFDGTTTITGFPSPPPFTGLNGSIYITTYNDDRAGDIYALLTNYVHYPSPQLQCSAAPSLNQFNLWIVEDTPGLAYSVQSSSELLNDPWQDMPVIGVDANTIWSAAVDLSTDLSTGFYRISAVPSPATSPPWPPQ